MQGSISVASGLRYRSRPISGTESRLFSLAADYGGVRSWEVEVLPLAVVPLDDVGRFPVFMINLENNATTIRLPHPMPPNQDSITDFCEHDASDPPLITLISMSPAPRALGTKVPAWDTG